MANGILTAKREPSYDDLLEERYHFPQPYLRTMERLVGNAIVYYESRRNRGRQAYVATAVVSRIDEDPQQADHYYARIEQYLDFNSPVPW